jgi:uncharacterized protein
MKILIAGASGFIGHELVKALKTEHVVTVLGRNKALLTQEFGQHTCYTWEDLDILNANEFDIIVNLCGFNISNSRWTEKIKEQIISSRVQTTERLANWLVKNHSKARFFCANAIGIYGTQDHNDTTLYDEKSFIDKENPKDFLSEIGVRWEAALQPAIQAGIPVVSTRFGVVIKKGSGILKKLYPSFYLGLGSLLGDGHQYISWIHIDDLVGAFIYLFNHPDWSGAFNLTSPNPITQAEFAKKLAKSLHRPLLFKIPSWFIQLIFGQMGEYLLLKGQRVTPKRLLETGYTFKYATLDQALKQEFEN